MSGHIVLAFTGVTENRVAIGHKAGKISFKIAAHFRVGIFLNQKRSGSVLKMKRDQAGLKICLRDIGGNFFGEFVKAASASLDLNFFNALAKHTQRT